MSSLKCFLFFFFYFFFWAKLSQMSFVLHFCCIELIPRSIIIFIGAEPHGGGSGADILVSLLNFFSGCWAKEKENNFGMAYCLNGAWEGKERKNLEGMSDCVSGAGEKDTIYLVGRQLDSLYILNFLVGHHAM